MDGDPLQTQRDVGPAVVTELPAAGFDDAEEIGRGGFGIVYRCTQVDLDRTVAVKVLTAEPDENRERFLREQRAMGRLTGHPNIVSVLQVGETDNGYPYLVMQYHRQGSMEARIRRLGPLPLDEVLRLGVKMAAALDTAHRVGILHRDVKPANILLTDYGEPALSDFGIAHITGGFTTATGTFTGSPAFTAPEILSGDPPSRSSDVYGIGATLFCALTGHAAFERRSGEQMVAQFLRIASESAPDLRESGIPDDVCAVVEKAMARDPHHRPSAQELGVEIQQLQTRHGLPVDDMALRAEPDAESRPRAATTGAHHTIGNLPVALTSFVGRRTELSEVRNMLAASRMVTLAGIGGVGKTRLALRAASDARPDFRDGVWLVELGELHDGSLLLDTVAAALGVRDESARPLRDVLVEFLAPRRLLLVLDNCEQVVESAAELAEALLRACPEVRVLATSREALGIGGEAVLRLPPLEFPDADREPTLRRAARLRRGGVVRRSGGRRGAGFRAHRRQQGHRRPHLLQTGRAAAGDRTGGGAAAGDFSRADPGAAGRPVHTAHPRQSWCADAAADSGLERRLELRPVHTHRATALGPALGVRRRLRTRSGRSRFAPSDLASGRASRRAVLVGGQVHPDPHGIQWRGAVPAARDAAGLRQAADHPDQPVPTVAAATRRLVPAVGRRRGGRLVQSATGLLAAAPGA